MDKDRKRGQRRFDTWRVQRNRIRREYETWDYAHDGPRMRSIPAWEDGKLIGCEYEWVYQVFWTEKRMGKLRWNHSGCSCSVCKPWKRFYRWNERQKREDRLWELEMLESFEE